MNFEQSIVNSGTTPLQGFKLDGKFSNVEGTPNYFAFNWTGNNKLLKSEFNLIWDQDFHLELVSINALGGSESINQLMYWSSFVNIPNFSNLPIWSANFSYPALPFEFPRGLLISPFSLNSIVISVQAPWLQIICRPVDPIFMGGLSPV